MIRHSSSFFVSLLVHTLLVVALFFTYKYVSAAFNHTKKEKIVCIDLQCLVPHKEKVLPKILPQKIIKAKPKPKPLKKKVLKPKLQKVPDVVIVQEKVVEEIVEEVEVEELIQESEELNAVVQEEKISPQKAYIDENINQIIALLEEHLYYPRRARKRGIQGDVLVRFKLSIEAQVSEIEVVSSSHDILSRGAVETIESLSGKFPHPKEELIISVPIPYRLK